MRSVQTCNLHVSHGDIVSAPVVFASAPIRSLCVTISAHLPRRCCVEMGDPIRVQFRQLIRLTAFQMCWGCPERIPLLLLLILADTHTHTYIPRQSSDKPGVCVCAQCEHDTSQLHSTPACKSSRDGIRTRGARARAPMSTGRHKPGDCGSPEATGAEGFGVQPQRASTRSPYYLSTCNMHELPHMGGGRHVERAHLFALHY